MTPTFIRILVATDFSPASDGALAYGRALASTFGVMGTHGRTGMAHLLMRPVRYRVAYAQRGTT